MRLTPLSFVILVAAALASACGSYFGDEACTDDPFANHAAINPATGDCWEFESSCDVPAGWMPCGTPIECDAERACPPDRICSDGVCVPVASGCTSDEDCAWTQHCDTTGMGAPTPPDIQERVGVCVDNAACLSDGECPAGQWCDFTVSGDCDPSVPGCGIAKSGICSRGPRPDGACGATGECPVGEVCLADHGGPNVCEPVCLDDTICAADEYCNAGEVCVTPSPGTPPEDIAVPPACYGWCAQRPGVCDVTADCASGEICPAEHTGELVSMCEKACVSSADCVMGEHCSVEDGYSGGAQPASPPDSGGGSGAPAEAPLVPCQGWCW
jgi:hypothetical protein